MEQIDLPDLQLHITNPAKFRSGSIPVFLVKIVIFSHVITTPFLNIVI